MEIRRVGVIGAGVMGSGIAAHIANAGILVDLLDIPAKTGPRDGIAA
ncbi:MAG: 3-hydroxyacyl-CoA dehydrogenase NAD-binding domain-containing protein, partial [Dongiales bacterium]